MTVTLNIAPDLENEVRNAADREGMPTDKYIVTVLKHHLYSAARNPPRLSETEAQLFQQINFGLPEATWRHYHQLLEKRRLETLEPDEHQTLLKITDEIEIANARRITALAKLAQLRDTTLDVLMDELGLRSPGYV